MADRKYQPARRPALACAVIRVVSACGVLSAFGGGAAHAQIAGDAPATDDQRAGHLYVRGGLGATFVDDLEQDVTTSPFADALTAGISTRTATVTEPATSLLFSAAVGFAFPASTRTEFEYRYSNVAVDRVTDFFAPPDLPLETGPQADLSFNTHFLMSNVYYDFKNRSRLTPFVGVGVGGANVSAVESNGASGGSDWAFAYQARAGVSLAVADNLSVDVEYLFVRTRALSFGPDEFVDETSGFARIDGDVFQSSSVLGSLRFAF